MLACAGVNAIVGAVRDGSASAVDIARDTLESIRSQDSFLRCFTDVTAERALQEAAAVDIMRAAGRPLGPLAGVPYAVKNLFDVAGLSTLAGAKINAERSPALRDAMLISRLKAAGAVLVGTLNMDAYAYGFTTENTHYGTTRNPHDTGRLAGGSSGGSAASVAAGMVPLALGSDTNGSIRVPASLCGVFGLKPTFGRLPRTGSLPFVASLDHLGPFARSAEDLALCYDAMQGFGEGDPGCVRRPVEYCAGQLDAGVADLRIKIAADYFETNAGSDALEAMELAARALNVKHRVVIPEAARARAAAYIVTASEGANCHLPDLKRRANDLEPLSRDRLLAGALVPAAWYIQAQRFRRWYTEHLTALFQDTDIILAPSTPVSAPLIGEDSMLIGGKRVPTRPNLGLLTQPISFAGLPVAAVPIYRPDRMPVGVQVIAAPWREDLCLRVAAELERLGVARAPIANL